MLSKQLGLNKRLCMPQKQSGNFKVDPQQVQSILRFGTTEVRLSEADFLFRKGLQTRQMESGDLQRTLASRLPVRHPSTMPTMVNLSLQFPMMKVYKTPLWRC